jgi:MOSC domain-containing protein YiiM
MPVNGSVDAIYIAATEGEPMLAVEQVEAVAGRGLRGDRHFRADEDEHDPAREVTLIEREAVEAAGRDYELKLDAGATRRNVVTRGVALNHLVGGKFRVGSATLRGLELCEPCATLARTSNQKGVIKALIHRGGLRAQILESGSIRIGDSVEVLDRS